MLFSDSYLSVKTEGATLYKDRGSRFFAFIFPVRSEEEIKSALEKLKKEHPSANHHCYAWRLGPDKSASRANDDGEPSNTAGKPILAQIQGHDLTNVLIVVVRYFGGTLLGVGGLVNAYKTAAVEAIKAAAIEEIFIVYEYTIAFGMDDMSAVMRLLKELDARIISNQFEEQNIVTFQIKKQHTGKLTERADELYRVKLTYIQLVN